MSEQVIYLMRGLPACGKSFAAKQLAGNAGVICETDQYFYENVGDDPERYDYSETLLPQARDWNFDRFQTAVNEGRSPIVVDRGNGRNVETQRYARYAVEHGYRAELREPDSPWWQELRVLLKYKKHLAPQILDQWAEALAAKSQESHRVPKRTIRRWMDAWKHDLTVDEILAYEPSGE